ncbi:hypothetical protein [Singulisphaera sp. PoT]|uniref:hypothetical protein n=1 Tax=Singulisphaera sp. PoT TaxID=3411797 RepID=UPI003BF4CAD8
MILPPEALPLRTLGDLAPGHRTDYRRVLSRAPWSGLRPGCTLARLIHDRLCPRGPVFLVADGLNNRLRFLAACSAARAGTGLGADAAGLGIKGRMRWRQQTRDWLKADLDRARELSMAGTPGLRSSLEPIL